MRNQPGLSDLDKMHQAQQSARSLNNTSPAVTDLHHRTHVTFDPSTGKFVGLPKEWEKAMMSTFGLPPALYVCQEVEGYNSKIPKVLVQMRQYLLDNGGCLQHGIFRVAPDPVERDRVLQQLVEGNFSGCRDIHCISTAIKVWFRELPTPLFKNLDIELLKTCNSDEEAMAMLNLLPEPPRSLSLWLMDMCCDVVEHVKVNAMSAKNMSIVISPNLFRCAAADPLDVMKLSKRFTDFFERCLNIRMRHRGLKTPTISVRPTTKKLSVSRRQSDLPRPTTPALSAGRELKVPEPPEEDEPEEQPPEPDSTDDELPPEQPPPPDEVLDITVPVKAAFVLPAFNPGELLSFQLAEYFPTWRSFLEPETLGNVCVECDEDAVVYCQMCKSYLCTNHDESFHAFRSRSQHVRIDAAQAIPQAAPCERHGEPMKLFCLNCACPACRDCREYDAHEGHMIVLIIFTAKRGLSTAAPNTNKPQIKTQTQKPEQKKPPDNNDRKPEVKEEKLGEKPTTKPDKKPGKPEKKEPRPIEPRVDEEAEKREAEKREAEKREAEKREAEKREAEKREAERREVERKEAAERERKEAEEREKPGQVKVERASVEGVKGSPTTTSAAVRVERAKVDSGEGGSLQSQILRQASERSMKKPPSKPAPAKPTSPSARSESSDLERSSTTSIDRSSVNDRVSMELVKPGTPTAATTSTPAPATSSSVSSTSTSTSASASASASAVTPISTAAVKTAAETTTAESTPTPPTTAHPDGFVPGQIVRALYDFTRGQKGYVPLVAREIVTVVKSSPQMSATGWVLVKNQAGLQGYVPINYVKAA